MAKGSSARSGAERGGNGGSEVLSVRALNRALLARQLLLARERRPALATIEHLVGMQGQAPLAPYVALWSRLVDFGTAELARLLSERQAVRATVMRTTLHLVSARDCLMLRPLVQPVLESRFASSPFARQLRGVDLAAVLAAGRALLAERARPRTELGKLLARQFAGYDATALAYAVSALVPLVQVTPRGIWGAGGPPALAPIETWLGRPLDPAPSLEDLVLRYLGAFGPASVMDIQAWCWLTRLGAVVERLRPRLRVFRDERGRELFDLPEAPRPDPQTPTPPRFLPEYDNVLLSHADRTRVMGAQRTFPLMPGNGAAMGTLLVDGFYRATWRIARERDAATLTITALEAMGQGERDAVAEEGARLLTFVAAEVGRHEVQLVGEW